MRKDQHIHDIFSLYLFTEREYDCKRCKLFRDNIIGSLIELYEEFARANSQDVEDDQED